MNMDKKKRQRCCNMTSSEKVLLADLVVKYSEVLENKRTDAVSAQVKAKCWQELAVEFNASSTSAIHREVTQLKHVC